ncbi:MAG: sorbosone dehydrogenase family protein [Nitrososphaeraceae archaeon]
MSAKLGFILSIISVLTLVCVNSVDTWSIYTYGQKPVPLRPFPFDRNQNEPYLTDPNLTIEEVVNGLEAPTTMSFLGPDDFLVLEKDKGTVLRVINGTILEKPLLDVEVANSVERGMCGIAVSKNGSSVYVFLYFTEIDGKDGEDRIGKLPEGNRLYRYELVDNQLVNPVLLLDLPADPGPRHNGGAIEIGPDNNIYIPVGDIDGSFKPFYTATKTQNSAAGTDTDGRSGILRITQEGEPVGQGILGDSMPLRLYYAYGIRNSFGLAFDPVTGSLWDTENGPQEGDEINLIYPGFNSGWHKVYGFSSSPKNFDIDEMVTFDDKGKYNEPKLVWGGSTGLTSIVFFDTDKLGTEYRNDIFVGAVHNSRIYHFDLNSERNDLVLPETVVAKYIENLPTYVDENIVFGDDFGGITDLTIGPDGYLYVVSIGQGKVFRILPNLSNSSDMRTIQSEEQDNIPTTNLSVQSEEQDNIPTTNLSVQSEEQDNIPITNLSEHNNIDRNENELLVSIVPLKDPVARGDSQSTRITVTDSASRAVANAEVDGILIYPGDNFEKEFTGITDSQGKFLYSWTIGENGDVGPLAIEVKVSSPGYPASLAVSSFDIVDSSADSE